MDKLHKIENLICEYIDRAETALESSEILYGKDSFETRAVKATLIDLKHLFHQVERIIEDD